MHRRLWQRLWLGVLLVAAVIGDDPAGVFAQATSKRRVATPAVEPEVEATRRGEVVASFDAAASGRREDITLGELEDAIAASGSFTRQPYLDQPAARALLDRSLRFELLAIEAERRGYHENLSVAQSVKQNAVQSMLKQIVDANVTPQSVPVEAVKKYYDDHLDEFVRPEMRRASQILAATEAEAKAVLEQVKTADMRGFRELARIKSRDETSKLRGGDLRYFDARGKPETTGPNLDPAVAKATFALKTVGDTSGVVKTEAGFAVLKLTGMRPAQEEAPKDADERIRTRLWREQREAAIDAMLAKLKQAQTPTVHPELIDAIRFTPDAVGPPNTGLPSGFPHTQPPPATTPKE